MTDEEKMERAIRVLTDVNDLGELIDGASVEQARVFPSGDRLRLELTLTRACPERATTVRRGLFTRTKVPWVKSRLTLDQITEASLQRRDGGATDQTPLISCEAIPGGYRFVVTSPEGLQLQLTLAQLNGQFVDIGKPIETQ